MNDPSAGLRARPACTAWGRGSSRARGHTEDLVNQRQSRNTSRLILTLALVAGLLGFWAHVGYAAKDKKASMPASVQEHAVVELEYTLTVDGAVVDSSQSHGPLKYEHGTRQLIPGLERELTGLHVGDSKEVTVKPADAYGEVDPTAVTEIPKAKLPKDTVPKVGMVLGGRDRDGHPFRARIMEIKVQTVRMDLNHPLAGKQLNFKVKVLSIAPAEH